MPLSPERRQQLDGIVLELGRRNAPQADVQAIVSDFTGKYGSEQTAGAPVVPQAQTQGPNNLPGGSGGLSPEDQASADQYQAWFPYNGNEGPVKAGLKAAGNLVPSGINLVGNVLGMVAHPIRTIKGIGSVAAGAAEAVGNNFVGLSNPNSPTGEFPQQQDFRNFVEGLKQRYVGHNLSRTAVNDPFGLGTDILSAYAGGAALAGKGAVALENAAEAGKVVTGAATRPLKATAAAARDLATPIAPGVRTALTRAGTTAPAELSASAAMKELGAAEGAAAPADKLSTYNRYVDAGKAAVKDNTMPTPLELAGKRGEEALAKLNDGLTKIGKEKQAITKSVSLKPTGAIVPTARQELKSMLADRLGATLKKDGTIGNAPFRSSKISDVSDARLVADVDAKLASLGKNPSLAKVDDAIDYIQDSLYKRSSATAVPVNTQVEGMLKQVAKGLNDNLKQVGGADYAKANDRYAAIVDVRDKLNKALGPEGTRGGSLMKKVFSPTDSGTKQLFSQVNDLTGINLSDEATLAKFVMEHLGDARQASLLEEAIHGKVSNRGIVQDVARAALAKVSDPIGKARRIIVRDARNTTASGVVETPAPSLDEILFR